MIENEITVITMRKIKRIEYVFMLVSSKTNNE